jgi:predicted transcriptional regulator
MSPGHWLGTVLFWAQNDLYYCIIHIVKAGIFLPFPLNSDTVGDVRDKESTAITITLPLALDRALQALADQKHCGNKSAAIREVLYKEAGMQAKLRMNEKANNAAIANAERRSVKYGARKKPKRK